jgi:splicing suppressor protein 51
VRSSRQIVIGRSPKLPRSRFSRLSMSTRNASKQIHFNSSIRELMSTMKPAYTCWKCLRTQVPNVLKRRPTQLGPYRSIVTKAKESHKFPQSRLLDSQSKAASTAAYTAPSTYDAAPNTVPSGGPSSYSPPTERVLLQPNNLFHPYSTSPSPTIRKRAAFMKHHAYCPHPDHLATRAPTSPDDPENRKLQPGEHLPAAHVNFECPDCGVPVSCSEEHWADDYENHLEICDTLRQINEDDHDLVSGRFFTEFEYPGPQIEEAMVNMTNWDTLLYTREFNAINDDRHMRQATRLLTYPLTIGSVLHELSPYSIRSGGRLTVEGLKSFSGE